jgi:hypothetical protein
MQVKTWLWEHQWNKKLCFRRNGTIKRHPLITFHIKTETPRYSNIVYNFTTRSTEFCRDIISFQELLFSIWKEINCKPRKISHVTYNSQEFEYASVGLRSVRDKCVFLLTTAILHGWYTVTIQWNLGSRTPLFTNNSVHEQIFRAK